MIPAALSGRTALVVGAGVAVADALRRAGADVVRRDPAEPVSVRRLVEQTLGAFGRLDLAVNGGEAREVSLAMRYQIPAMRGTGRVVNLATMADVIEVTRAAAVEFAGSGVLINAVAAGPGDSAEDVVGAVLWLCSAPVSAGGAGRRW
jgi:NAD(P)-dependent dehydrogenase (short-subunit alcohol dehydrogenase family)